MNPQNDSANDNALSYNQNQNESRAENLKDETFPQNPVSENQSQIPSSQPPQEHLPTPTQVPQANNSFAPTVDNQTAATSFSSPQQDLPLAHTFSDASIPPLKPPSSKRKFILLGILLFLFFVLAGASGLTYAVAYKKIKLSKYPEFQKKVSIFVQSLSFTPKTPEFILLKSTLAHQNVTKQTFDVSLAIESDDFTKQLGLSTIDVQAKGAVDYSDSKNVKFFVEAFITKDFNFEIRKADKILYFKLKKLPSFLLSLLGINTQVFDPIVNRWVAYDTTPLDTEARRSLEDKEVEPLSKDVEENFKKYIDEKVLEKMKLEVVTEDNKELYKITLDADPPLIDHIGEKIESEKNKEKGASVFLNQGKALKLSEVIKSMKWELYFDKKNYYNQKTIVNLDLDVDEDKSFNPFLMSTSGIAKEKSRVSFAFAIKSDKFGEDINVEIPQEYMTFEEFLNTLSQITQEFYAKMISQTTQPPAVNE